MRRRADLHQACILSPPPTRRGASTPRTTKPIEPCDRLAPGIAARNVRPIAAPLTTRLPPRKKSLPPVSAYVTYANMGQVADETQIASPPDPAQDRPATTAPNNISVFLHAVGILLAYGRHLVDTIHQRATAPHFGAIASCFGTASISTILAHLNRGLLRAAALERVLLARAAAGGDIEFAEPRTPRPEVQPAPIDATPGQPAAEAPVPTTKRPRLPRPAGWDNPELYMPTLEDLERQARRHPVGRTILDICLDLAVVPGLCHRAFWSELFDVITYFGSNVNKVMQEKSRRWRAYDKEQDTNRGANWDWMKLSPDALRHVLGFAIGEPPVYPLD